MADHAITSSIALRSEEGGERAAPASEDLRSGGSHPPLILCHVIELQRQKVGRKNEQKRKCDRMMGRRVLIAPSFDDGPLIRRNIITPDSSKMTARARTGSNRPRPTNAVLWTGCKKMTYLVMLSFCAGMRAHSLRPGLKMTKGK